MPSQYLLALFLAIWAGCLARDFRDVEVEYNDGFPRLYSYGEVHCELYAFVNSYHIMMDAQTKHCGTTSPPNNTVCHEESILMQLGFQNRQTFVDACGKPETHDELDILATWSRHHFSHGARCPSSRFRFEEAKLCRSLMNGFFQVAAQAYVQTQQQDTPQPIAQPDFLQMPDRIMTDNMIIAAEGYRGSPSWYAWISGPSENDERLYFRQFRYNARALFTGIKKKGQARAETGKRPPTPKKRTDPLPHVTRHRPTFKIQVDMFVRFMLKDSPIRVSG